MLRTGILCGALLLSTPALAAEPTVIHVGDRLARLELVKPGVHRYLRYKILGEQRELIDIWTRRVSLESQQMHIVQRWDEIGPPAFYLIQDSWFDPSTFRPTTHVRRGNKTGEVKVKAYRFLPDEIIGMADLAENTDKDYRMAATEPAFNFEYDMEFLQALPLVEGYQASIPFFDAGIDKKPDRYVFKVAGSEKIQGPDGGLVDCWLVTADYNTGQVRSRFWFDKKTQLMIHEEAPLEGGGMLVKTLIGSESADKA